MALKFFFLVIRILSSRYTTFVYLLNKETGLLSSLGLFMIMLPRTFQICFYMCFHSTCSQGGSKRMCNSVLHLVHGPSPSSVSSEILCLLEAWYWRTFPLSRTFCTLDFSGPTCRHQEPLSPGTHHTMVLTGFLFMAGQER